MKETRIPVLSIQMITAAMMMLSIGLMIPRLGEELSLDLAQRAKIVSAQFTGATIAILFGGILSDKLGKTFITKMSLGVSAIFLIFLGLSWNYPAAYVATFLLGGSSITLENAINSSALDLGEKSARANSAVQACFTIGGIIVPLLFLFFDRYQKWRPVYFCIAFVAAIGALTAKGKMIKGNKSNTAKMLANYLTFIKKPKYWFGGIGLFLYVAAEAGLWAFAPTLFEAQGYGPSSGIVSSVLVWLMMLIGRIISTMLIDKVSIYKILIPSGIVAVACYLGIMFTNGILAIILVSIAGFACAPFFALILSMATQSTKDNSSSHVAFAMGMGTLGPAVMSEISGTIGEVFGARFFMLPQLICYALLTIMIAAVSIHRRHSR